MPKKPTSAVAAAIAARSTSKPAPSLEELKAVAAMARDLELRISNGKTLLAELMSQLNALYFDKLPTLMNEAGVDNIGLSPEGNKPGVDYKLRTNYSATISTKWPEEKQSAAFDLLTKKKAEALIKTEVKAALPKGSLKKAQKLAAAAKKLGITVTIKKSVHHGSLSAWLKDYYVTQEKSLSIRELEIIGGFVGQTVKPEERDNDE